MTKKNKIIKETINKKISYNFNKAVEILKKLSSKNFVETVEISINIQTSSKDLNMRGYSLLPNNSGKKLKIAVFVDDEELKNINSSNIDLFIDNKEINNIKENKIHFDIMMTTPKSILKLSQIGNILGPRGLMPNIKYGTITNEINKNIEDMKTKYIKFKNDKNNIIHVIIGKINFETSKLKENLESLIKDIKKSKPIECKKMIISKITLSTTMGPGLTINSNSLTY